MRTEFVSDRISIGEIEGSWKFGDKILVTSQTGSGKTLFAQNVIYEFAKRHNLKVILFSNRTLLRGQNSLSLEDKTDIFTMVNYQNINEKIYGGISVLDIYDGYDIILMDEAHFYMEDSPFNRKTDLLLKSLKEKYPSKIIILMTATPEVLFEYHPRNKYDHIYDLEKDYSHIEKITFYRNEKTVAKILSLLPENEKAIYFARKTERAYEMNKLFADRSSFICAVGSKFYGKLADTEAMEMIVSDCKFPKQFLCSTKLLDTGVNIKDESLTTIIIDSSNPVNIIQSIGRKRILSEKDKLKIYIRELNGNDVYQRIKECRENLDWVGKLKKLGKDEFLEEFRKSELPPIIDNDMTVNVAVETYYRFMLKFYLKMRSSKINFRKYIYESFQYKDLDFESDAEFELQKPDIINLIEKYKNEKLFSESQKKMRNEFSEIIISSDDDYERMGLNAISNIIKKSKLPYNIVSKRERKNGENKNKKYWMFLDKEKDNENTTEK